MNNKNYKSDSSFPFKEALFLFLITIYWGNAAVATSLYSVVDIGPIGSSYAINASGQVVGQLRFGSANHAFLYSDGQIQDLGAFVGNSSIATAINDSGMIAGYSSMGTGNPGHAFIWDGSLHDIGTLPGGSYSEALGINNNGDVVGVSDHAIASGHLFQTFLYAGGVMVNIGESLFPGCGVTINCRNEGHDINNNGQMIGVQGPQKPAFLYDVASGPPAQELNFNGSAGSFNYAIAINDAGQVTGYGTPPDSGLGPYHAFLYSGGVMQDLETLGGNSYGYGINELGQVVGSSNAHGFLYTDGQMLDLNALLYGNPNWTITEARGINDAGQIVGTAVRGGTNHAVLLNPVVPIPGALWLFGSAMAALIGFGAGRNRPGK